MISPPPWRLSDDEQGRIVKELPAPDKTRLVRPLFYCQRGMPKTDEDYGQYHEPQQLKIQKLDDVYLLERHVVLSQASSEVLSQTFLRGKHKHHGGVFVAHENEQGIFYRPKTSYDIETGIRFDRPLYFADTDKPDVFGHVLLEVLPRLWGMLAVGEHATVATSVSLNPNYAAMFSAIGVERSSILKINRPIIARSVFVPSLPVVRRSWVHPEAWNVFDRLKLLSVQSDAQVSERIYISRSRVPGRELVNELEIESFFASKGFRIVHPQELPIQTQIKLFRHARLIAGTGGSAMHNALFASEDARILILSSDKWVVNADMLLSQVPDRLGYVLGSLLNDDEAREKRRVQSPWRIELAKVREAVKYHFSIK